MLAIFLLVYFACWTCFPENFAYPPKGSFVSGPRKEYRAQGLGFPAFHSYINYGPLNPQATTPINLDHSKPFLNPRH